jgi:hypothetical protein
VTEPNEFDEFRERQERQERRRLFAMRVVDVLTVLALAAIAALVLKMIFFSRAEHRDSGERIQAIVQKADRGSTAMTRRGEQPTGRSEASMKVGPFDVRTLDDCLDIVENAFQSAMWKQLPQDEKRAIANFW